jgi:hypothetical protein
MISSAWMLVLLNSLDGIATYVGISLFIISEANPLLAELDPFYILMIKLYLSTFLAMHILHHPKQLFARGFKYLLSFANVCYLGVFSTHIFWISLSMVYL